MARQLSLYFSIIAMLLSFKTFAAQVIITGNANLVPPPAQEIVIVPPPGYSNCHVVPAGYHHGVWVSQHRVCEYHRGPRTAVWISGFWQCDHLKHHSICRHWTWVPSRWEISRASFVAFPPPPTTHTVIVAPPQPTAHAVIVTPPPRTPHAVIIQQPIPPR